jgi:sensor c-di-GMP phosphodiesterase-like protein
VAHALRISTVAEGVERQAQLAVVKALGCDAVQGYLLSRALDAAHIANWLSHWQSSVVESLAGPVTVPGLELEPGGERKRWLN